MILAALIIAFNGLGLTYITDLLGRVVLFVPKIFVALLILAFGAYFARFIGDAVRTYCSNIDLRDGEFLGRLAQYAIIAFVVLIALDQVHIGGDIVRQSFLILLGRHRVRARARVRSRRQGLGGGAARALVAACTGRPARRGSTVSRSPALGAPVSAAAPDAFERVDRNRRRVEGAGRPA